MRYLNYVRTFIYWIVILICPLQLLSCAFLRGPDPVKYIQYPVRPGETLTTIAKRFDVFTSELRSINDLNLEEDLEPGRYIRVPYRGQSLAMEKEDAEFVKIVKRSPAKTDSTRGSLKQSTRRVGIGSSKKHVGNLATPVEDPKVSSPFGTRWMKFHEGVDFRAPVGTKIRAAHDGKVVFVSEHFSGYGKTIVIQEDEFLTVYAHNSKNRVSTGDRVKKGDWIANVGQTGDATGPHLHFETRVRDSAGEFSAVNPFTFLK